MNKNQLKYYATICILFLIFIVLMSLAVLNRIIDTNTYLLYSFVLLYIIYIYVQITK